MVEWIGVSRLCGVILEMVCVLSFRLYRFGMMLIVLLLVIILVWSVE